MVCIKFVCINGLTMSKALHYVNAIHFVSSPKLLEIQRFFRYKS
jgi:hypothetical protein